MLHRFVADQSGVTAIEYRLVASLIAVAIIGAVATLGSNLTTVFNQVAAQLTDILEIKPPPPRNSQAAASRQPARRGGAGKRQEPYPMKSIFIRFVGNDSGVTAIEYALILIALLPPWAWSARIFRTDSRPSPMVSVNGTGPAAISDLLTMTLAGIDRSAGLDWWAYVTSVKSDPFFGRILTYAYQSSVWQLAAAILLLGFTRRSARLDMQASLS